MSLVQTFFLSPNNGDCKWSLCFGKTSMSSKTRINCHFPLVEINKKEHLRFPKMYAYVWVFRFISLSPIQFDISRVIYLHRKPIGYTSNEFKIMLAFFALCSRCSAFRLLARIIYNCFNRERNKNVTHRVYTELIMIRAVQIERVYRSTTTTWLATANET